MAPREVVAAAQDCGSLTYTRDIALAHRDEALEALASLPDSDARGALEELAQLAVERRA